MADKPILIFGNVKDNKGTPVSEARVSFVSGPIPLTDIAALTDNKGGFVLSAPVPGEYMIEVVAEGFISKSIKISTGDNREKRIEISLSGSEGEAQNYSQ